MSYELNIPPYWERKSLLDLCEKVECVKRKLKDPSEEFLYFDIGGINNSSNKIVNFKYYNWRNAPSRAQQIVKYNDILFSTVRTYMKNIALIDSAKYDNQIASSGFCVLRVRKHLIEPKFIFYLTLFDGFIRPLNELQTGSSYPAIRDKDVFSQLISFPPLSEQRAIVAKIEELLSDLENGRQQLLTAQQQLKVYRQSLLKAAFEGKLTGLNCDSYDLHDGHDFDSRDSSDVYDSDNTKTSHANPVNPTNHSPNHSQDHGNHSNPMNPGSDLPINHTNHSQNHSPLPKGWEWVKLGDVCNKIGDIDHKMPKQLGTGYPYVSTKDFTDNLKISFDNVKYISKDDYLNLSKKIKPEKGDIIFPRYGTIGKNILVDFDKEFLVSYSCAVIKPNIARVISKYVYYYSLSPLITKEIKKYTVETTQANVGIASIKSFVFPLPSLPEQQLIVEELESKLTVCDKIEETITQSLAQAETLKQSILKKAFEGKLV